MKEACGDTLYLKPILSFKKEFEGKLFIANGGPWTLLDFHTSPFLTHDCDADWLTIMQNLRPGNEQKRHYWPLKFASPITSSTSSHSSPL